MRYMRLSSKGKQSGVYSLMEWVVETARHQYVATISQVPATVRDVSMPYIYISGASCRTRIIQY